jgi:Tol biopolymer transport system component
VKILTTACLVAVLLSANGPPANAAFPGSNGRIAFFTASRTPIQVFTIRPTGGGRKQLTSRGRNSFPKWSADGSKIAFAHNKGVFKLETMSPDGSGKTVVLASPPSGYADFEDFSWSPDGSSIAFCAFRTIRAVRLDLFVVGADGTGLTKIANRACDPSWSPLGGSIAFTTFGSDLLLAGIDTIAPDGTGRTRVISGKNTYPDWSPDGTRIVYSHRVHHQWDLFVVAADGTGRTRLTSTRRRRELTPVFSPDGTKIVFSASRRKPDPKTFLFYDDLFTIATDGSGRTRLTDTPSIDEFAPSWEPM